MKNKIKKYIKNKTLIRQIQKKIHSIFPIYWIHNKNIEFQYLSCITYNKYKKLYKNILEKGVEVKNSVPSEYVWICWFQGLDTAPELVKTCINSIYKCMKNKKIVILTNENISEYVEFPKYIVEKRNKGIISDAHFSDILRTELLCKYGGIWIDATVLCTSQTVPDYLEKYPIFVYKQLDLCKLDVQPIRCSSWLIYSKSNDSILRLTRKLLYTYWENNNYLEDYFLFHVFFSISCERYDDEWRKLPFYNNNSPQILVNELNEKYDEARWNTIVRESDFHKLSHHITYRMENDSFYSYILGNYGGLNSEK